MFIVTGIFTIIAFLICQFTFALGINHAIERAWDKEIASSRTSWVVCHLGAICVLMALAVAYELVFE